MSICPLSLPRLSSCRFPAARTTRRTRRSRGTIRRAAIASPTSRARKAPTRCWPSSSSPATGRARPRWAYGVLGDLADTGVERRERASPLAQLQEGQTGWAGEAGGDGARRGDHRPSHGDGCQSRGGGFPRRFPGRSNLVSVGYRALLRPRRAWSIGGYGFGRHTARRALAWESWHGQGR